MEIFLDILTLILCILNIIFIMQISREILSMQQSKENEYKEINKILDREMKALSNDEYEDKYQKFQSENDLYTNKKR